MGAEPRVERRPQPRLGVGGDRRRRHQGIAFAVVGGRRDAEADGRPVALVVAGQVGREPRRLADEDHDHAARQRIERAGVSDALLAEDTADPADDVV
jgi:hypothetical protein